MSIVDSIISRRFPAMGCRASVSLVASDHDLAARLPVLAERRVRHLQRCWSRFDESSDLSAINRADGRAVVVDPSTIELAIAMIGAHRVTNGACDAALHSSPGVGLDDLDRIRIDSDRNIVQFPAGTRLDPGSLGKGLAADLVSRQLLMAGASGVLVEIGGDLRVTGVGPHLGFWSIAVEDPFGESNRRGSVLVREGGVSTSGLSLTFDVEGPHNISVDPRTGRSLSVETTRVVSATVIAGSAVEAETWSTALLVNGDADLEPVIRRGCSARVTLGSGDTRTTGEWTRIFNPDLALDEVAHV